MTMKRWMREQQAAGLSVCVIHNVSGWDISLTREPLWCMENKRAQGKTFRKARERIEAQEWQQHPIVTAYNEKHGLTENSPYV